MSFFSSLLDIGSSALKYLGGSGVGPALAKTAISAFALNQVTKSINKKNDATQKTTGNRIQLDPDTENAIPVLYGEAFVKPMITDAYLDADNKTMYFALTLCEKTGSLLSTSAASVISFDRVYYNDLLVTFRADGYTVASFSDEDGTTSTDPDGLIEIYPFSGGSQFPVLFTTQASGNAQSADQIMPNWSSVYSMTNLVFAVVKIQYNKEKNVTSLGNLVFKLSNTMTLPGDCIYDYMTNTRYGAGIDSGEILT